jgi:hypothetical protein
MLQRGNSAEVNWPMVAVISGNIAIWLVVYALFRMAFH